MWWSCILIYVCGLSHGRILQRFTVLSIPTQDFLETEEALTKYIGIKDKKWQCDLSFLTDITVGMNEMHWSSKEREKASLWPS